MRTPDEIKRQVEGLRKDRKSLREFNAFNESNWGKIDAQIDIITGRRAVDDFEDDYYREENGEDSPVYQAAMEAEAWLDGSIKDDLFDDEQS